ncbi:MAG TPA: arginase family protein [Rubrobacter sp.]|nr:arginase family protein [Rubrobacter sp.]
MGGYPDVRVIVVPYDSGHRGIRMGAGPEHLVNGGLGEVLRTRGRSPSFATVCPGGDPPAEVAIAFELDGLVSGQVSGALAEDEFPLVLSGNCNTSVGTIAGAGSEGLGVVWFNAHADFNTPETTTSGFTDGMGLAVAVGRCWKSMAAGVPGFSPVAEQDVVLAGVRDVQPAEEERLAASKVTVVGADPVRREGPRALTKALDGLKARVGRVYVHLDLDVLDAEEVGRANEFAPEGGLGAEELLAALGMVSGRFDVAAVGIASYDPTFDADGRVLGAALACVEALTAASTPAA